MIKTLQAALDLEILGQISLLVFVVVFIAVAIRTIRQKPEVIQQQASVVFHDGSEDRS
jgi:hypothetical protein